MKILILCKNYVDIVGGVEYVTQYLSEQYSLRKHDVHVIAHLNSDTIFHPTLHCGATIHYISTPSHLSKLKNYLLGKVISSLYFSFKSYRLIHGLKPDVIHVQHTEQSIEACLARIIDKIPYCIAFHGEWKNGIMFPKNLDKIWKYYPNIRFASCITALTSVRAKEIADNLSCNPIIVPNGVDSILFCPRASKILWPSPCLELITVSRLTSIKRINDVILALSSVVKINPNIHLTIVGTGEEEETLKEEVRKMSLNDKVTFTGFISQEQKIEYLQRSHLFLIPSLYEGFPLTILEAFATGIPVITTPVSSASELIVPGKTGFIVPFCNPDSIAESIVEIMNLPYYEYCSMKDACRTLSLNYDWKSVACKYESIYNNMMISKNHK